MASAERRQLSNSFFSTDSLVLGGLSIIVCLFSWAFMDKNSSLLTVSQLAFALAFIINHPHFLSSYTLLYWDFGRNVLRRTRYFWAGVLVPLILLSILLSGLVTENAAMMGHTVTAMFFFVGWHYVKQVFGCIIVTSAQRKIFYKRWEKNLILFNLYTLWFMSWIGSHVGSRKFDFYGIPHYSFNLPPWMLSLSYVLVSLSFLVALGLHVNKYVRDGQLPSAPGVSAHLALYVWYLPVASHPGFAYLIPLFHSLQYLGFVWLLKFNEVSDKTSQLEGPSRRRRWIQDFAGYLLVTCILGALFFEIIPKGLDQSGFFSPGALGGSPFLASFLLFINIHHYFIDNVIWKSDNEFVKKYLFYSPETEDSQTEGDAKDLSSNKNFSVAA